MTSSSTKSSSLCSDRKDGKLSYIQCYLCKGAWRDPVVAPDGYTYCRGCIKTELETNPGRSPVTGESMNGTQLYDNRTVEYIFRSMKNRKGVYTFVESFESEIQQMCLVQVVLKQRKILVYCGEVDSSFRFHGVGSLHVSNFDTNILSAYHGQFSSGKKHGLGLAMTIPTSADKLGTRFTGSFMRDNCGPGNLETLMPQFKTVVSLIKQPQPQPQGFFFNCIW